MTKSLFRQSFLTDTLDVHIDVAPAEQVLSNGVQLKLYQRGVLEVIPENPTQETKNIIISCGIHGDETAPMELVDSIIKDIESGFQKVDARCLFIIAHPESTLAHTRFLEENLNRLFDEKEHEPTKELAIADTLKLLVRDFYQDTDPKNALAPRFALCNSWFETLHVCGKPKNAPPSSQQSVGGFSR